MSRPYPPPRRGLALGRLAGRRAFLLGALLKLRRARREPESDVAICGRRTEGRLSGERRIDEVEPSERLFRLRLRVDRLLAQPRRVGGQQADLGDATGGIRL